MAPVHASTTRRCAARRPWAGSPAGGEATAPLENVCASRMPRKPSWSPSTRADRNVGVGVLGGDIGSGAGLAAMGGALVCADGESAHATRAATAAERDSQPPAVSRFDRPSRRFAVQYASRRSVFLRDAAIASIAALARSRDPAERSRSPSPLPAGGGCFFAPTIGAVRDVYAGRDALSRPATRSRRRDVAAPAPARSPARPPRPPTSAARARRAADPRHAVVLREGRSPSRR